MFIVNDKGNKEVKKGLTERVLKFAKACNEFGIYELSEGGLSPDNYYKEWLEICKNTTAHLGEDLKVSFLTPPSDDFKGKGSVGLVDGNKGYKDFNINWIGWYGTEPSLEIETKNCDNLTENDQITTKSWEIINQKFSSFIKIKILIKPQTELPSWRKRKNKKPMLMMDEIELYKK